MCNDCTRLHEQLQQQSYEMYGLKRRIIRLRSELKKERREKDKILKEKEKNHYRNGQKRGKFGRN